MNNTEKIPNHVAIIVDGNGRWAKENGVDRSCGHKEGSENINRLSKYIFSRGIKYLSLYVFSTENFKRSQEEVGYLMKLFIKVFKAETNKLHKENIKVIFSGRKDPLPKNVLIAMDSITEQTKNNTGGVLNFCLNYGGKAEIVDATLKIHKDITAGNIIEDDVTEDLLLKYMYNDLPPVDLMIRTSGEQRLSNYLLYQNAYAEFYFSKTYFPAFDNQAFDEAIIEYTKRDRRFGGIKYEDKSN